MGTDYAPRRGGEAHSRSVQDARSDRRASRGGKNQTFPNDLGTRQGLLGQVAVRIQDQRDGFLQIRARLVESIALSIRARQLFDERDIALGHFHVRSRKFHLGYTLSSSQRGAAGSD
jgi:hypothetical protein